MTDKVKTASGVYVPAFQEVMDKSAGINQVVTVTYSGTGIPSNFFQATSQSLDLKIERSQLPARIKDVTLRFKVTNAISSDVQLAQVHDWIEHYEVKQGTRELFRDYNDSLKVASWAAMPVHRGRTMRKLCNLIPDRDTFYNCGYLAASATDYFYLPIPHAFFEHFNPDLSFISGDLYFTLYPNSSGIAIDGTNHPTLVEIAIIYNTNKLPTSEANALAAINSGINGIRFLKPYLVKDTLQSWAASSSYNVDLSQVRGKVPYLLCSLRANPTTNTSNGNLKNLDWGDGTTVQVRTPAGNDILFSGSPIRAQMLTQHAMFHQVPNVDYFESNNWYVLPFCNNVWQTMAYGAMDGFYQFDGGRNELVINTSAAGTNCVQTVTITGTQTTGESFRIGWRGSWTDSLSRTASTSAMATAFNALSSSLNYPDGPITATFSASASSGSFTITFSGLLNPYPKIEDLVEIIYDSSTSQVSTSTAMTTRARSGFLAGTYQMYVYAPVFASLTLVNGVLDVKEL